MQESLIKNFLQMLMLSLPTTMRQANIFYLEFWHKLRFSIP